MKRSMILLFCLMIACKSFSQRGISDALNYKHNFQNDIENLHRETELDRQARLDAQSRISALWRWYSVSAMPDTIGDNVYPVTCTNDIGVFNGICLVNDNFIVKLIINGEVTINKLPYQKGYAVQHYTDGSVMRIFFTRLY